MKYTFGTFLISLPDEITNVKSLDDLWQLTKALNATEGVPAVEKLKQLNLIVTASNEDFLSPIDGEYLGESQLFLVSRSFRDAFATADNEYVTKVASDWSHSESWRDTDVNPFDIYGMLHYLKIVCARGRAEDKELYLLLTI